MTNQTQVSVQAQVFIPRDYQVFAGLDVDKNSIAATFCNHEGLLRSLRLLYSAPQLLNYVRKHFPEQRLAFVYEAGPTGFGLYDELVAEGHPCLVVAPAMVPQAPGARVKTNRLDSQKLSAGLRGGQLRSIHVPSVKYRELPHLVQLGHARAAVDGDQMPDDSPNRHTTKHAHASGHPVIASAEPGERWLYCYPDDALAEY